MAMILTIDPSKDLAKVVKQLKKDKLRVTSVLEGLHIVTVDGDDAALQRVRAMPAVIGAEPETVVRLDPREVPDLGPDRPAKADRSVTPKAVGASWRSAAWDDGTA